MNEALELICDGCGTRVCEPLAFACPERAPGDVTEHVLQYPLTAEHSVYPDTPLQPDEHPFVRYRSLLRTGALASSLGLSAADYAELVLALDARIRLVYGRSFRVTPYARQPALAASIGLSPSGGLWIKPLGPHRGNHPRQHIAHSRCRHPRIAGWRQPGRT